MLNYTKNFFNDQRLVDKLFFKQTFPYRYLDKVWADGQIDEAVLEGPIPSIEEFQNDLKDPRSSGGGHISQADYDALLELANNLQLLTFGQLLSHYNCSDVVLTITCVKVIDRFYFENFGLSLLRCSSLSRYSFQVLNKGVMDEYHRGVETLWNPEQKAFLTESIQGGMAHTLYNGGRVRFSNLTDLPEFDEDKVQRAIISLDVNR